MPVTETSGVAATVNPQNPILDSLEGFADQLMKAKSQQKQEAMAQLDWMMKTTERSGGKFLPDPAAVEKLIKKAGLPKMMTGAGGTSGGTTNDMFKAMASHAQKLGEADEAKAAAEKDQAEHDSVISKLETKLGDPDLAPEVKSKTLGALASLGKRTLSQVLEAGVMDHLNTDQREHLLEAKKRELMGEPSDKDIADHVMELTPKLIEDYDGDTGKAMEAATLLAHGEKLPPELQPPMTDKRLDQDAKIAQMGIELGWSSSMTAQAMAARTTDVKKLSELYGWDPKVVAKLQPLKTRQVAASEREAAASERSAAASERTAASTEKLRDIQLSESKALSAERVARAFKEIQQGLHAGGKDPEMKSLLAQLEGVRRLQTIDKKAVPEETKKALTDQLMKSLTDADGVPLMREEDIPTFFGLSSAKGWTFNPPSDPKATETESAGGPQKQPISSLVTPSVMEEFMKQLPKDAQKVLQSIPDGINKFAGMLDDMLSGGHAARGASGTFDQK